MLLKTILLTVLSTYLLASSISLEFLKSKPKSFARDFYILEYMKQDISQDELEAAYSLVKRKNSKLFKEYAKKTKKQDVKNKAKCQKISAKSIIKLSPSCIVEGLNYKKAAVLSNKELMQVSKKLKTKDRLKSKTFYAMSRKDVFGYILKRNNTFFELFNNSYRSYKVKHLNKTIPLKYLNRLSTDKRFNKSIELIVANPVYDNLQNSLLNVNPKNQNFRATFLLGVNAIRLGYEVKALEFFDKALKKAYYQMDKDNIYFWQYLITKEQKYIDILNKSWDINMYSVIARQKSRIPFDNIYSSHCSSIKKPSIDILDPFAWIDIQKENKDLEKRVKAFKSCDELPHKAVFETKLNNYKKHFYVQPYKEHLMGVDPKRKALIYAIARQESRFIPASISHSYALGMMQFMPFLARATAKELEIKNFQLTDMFKPNIGYKFADHHLDYLEKHLEHPLYISYAYNGGIGFTTRMLKEDYFKNKKYEPYLSMELVPYKESRRYGKKVIANYVIYAGLLGEDLNLENILNELIKE
ncbi:MAG: Soluble lytic murein transglycosylase precursor (EC [uncultured Campylobacterales bacterium]|uniref:Soluble lytic murein transglycosylase (EC) n=1 Tax=uncultured Campylobacterales bacterium TaxID=352960 RepID=A0A6S6ST08_9BACT|nr:MAG: Soluble lytic murein transglycosylase precursor (EC [uncultured Campylobacterales bacterium]